jgi:hypothetical protein
MEALIKYLPFLIPVALIELGLMAAALVHICRHKNYRTGNRTVWVILVVVLENLGPILYFTIGKGDE